MKIRKDRESPKMSFLPCDEISSSSLIYRWQKYFVRISLPRAIDNTPIFVEYSLSQYEIGKPNKRLPVIGCTGYCYNRTARISSRRFI